MKPPRTPIASLVLLAAPFFVGCASSTAENRIEVREGEFEVLSGNQTILSSLDAKGVRTRRIANDFLEFQVTLVNTSSGDLHFQWIVEWSDAQGFKLEDPTQTWQAAYLNGKALLDIQRVSPTATASKARVRVMAMNEIK
jgi:uncharacterized protein YcfL